MYFAINNVYSEYDYIRSGVVQGSCLVLLIYINDITDCFDDKVNCKLYADDVKLYTELRPAADSNCFQVCLDRIYQWSLTWLQLRVSSQKCCVMDVGKSTATDAGSSCRLGNEGLMTSENVRDLGVVVDSHLCFRENIANIASKAHQRANLIHRCFSSRNRDILVKAFKVYVRLISEFNSPVWSPSLMKNILLIESVQKEVY